MCLNSSSSSTGVEEERGGELRAAYIRVRLLRGQRRALARARWRMERSGEWATPEVMASSRCCLWLRKTGSLTACACVCSIVAGGAAAFGSAAAPAFKVPLSLSPRSTTLSTSTYPPPPPPPPGLPVRAIRPRLSLARGRIRTRQLRERAKTTITKEIRASSEGLFEGMSEEEEETLSPGCDRSSARSPATVSAPCNETISLAVERWSQLIKSIGFAQTITLAFLPSPLLAHGSPPPLPRPTLLTVGKAGRIAHS